MRYFVLLPILFVVGTGTRAWAVESSQEHALNPAPPAARPVSTGSGYPELFFEYADAFDMDCPHGDKPPITGAMQDEVVDKLIPRLRESWLKESGPLLGETIKLLGKPFTRRELTVHLTLCRGVNPMSSPFMLNARGWIKEGSPYPKPLPMSVLTEDIFHEILHIYLGENYDEAMESSPLLKKYEKENATVRQHLHLDAIQQAVLTKLNRQKELDEIIRGDRKIPIPGYGRAWDIVKKEGAKAFLDELHASPVHFADTGK